jgi:hypothetical protein
LTRVTANMSNNTRACSTLPRLCICCDQSQAVSGRLPRPLFLAKARKGRCMRTKLLLVAVVAALTGLAASADAAPNIRDMCNQTSGDGQGHTCPGPDDLLLRPKYEDGTCGDWMCCAPNSDGRTYDCSNPTNPTRAAIGVLRGLRIKSIDVETDLGPPKPPAFPGSKPQTMTPDRGSRP